MNSKLPYNIEFNTSLQFYSLYVQIINWQFNLNMTDSCIVLLSYLYNSYNRYYIDHNDSDKANKLTFSTINLQSIFPMCSTSYRGLHTLLFTLRTTTGIYGSILINKSINLNYFMLLDKDNLPILSINNKITELKLNNNHKYISIWD